MTTRVRHVYYLNIYCMNIVLTSYYEAPNQLQPCFYIVTCTTIFLTRHNPVSNQCNLVPNQLPSGKKCLTMYACIELPFVELPVGSGVQMGLGMGPINKVGPMSQPRGYHQSRVMYAGSYLHTWCAFCNQFYSRQLREEQCRTGPVSNQLQPCV